MRRASVLTSGTTCSGVQRISIPPAMDQTRRDSALGNKAGNHSSSATPFCVCMRKACENGFGWGAYTSDGRLLDGNFWPWSAKGCLAMIADGLVHFVASDAPICAVGHLTPACF